MAYSSRANIQIRKVLVGRGNTAVSSTYTGVRGEITMDTDLKTLRIHDGVQVGGYIMASRGWVNLALANAVLGNVEILNDYATIAYVNSTVANSSAVLQANITTLFANTVAQQTQDRKSTRLNSSH